MHIPDGFLNLPVNATLGVVSITALGASIRRLKSKLSDKMIPLMGIMAAFIFAAQMFNFPIAGGTSGHLMGAVLAAVVVGPAAATVVLTVVLIVQCILFQDGGLFALGANVFNMAVVGVWIGYIVYSILKKLLPKKLTSVSVFVASWTSIVAAASACAVELAFSGTASIKIVLPAMAGVHAVIGIGEGVITAIVLSLVRKARPDIFFEYEKN